jgi:hypothetical protein
VAWDCFYRQFEFRASMDAKDWPAITEPVPSVSWDLALSRDDFDERWASGRWRFAMDEDAVNRLVMVALQACVQPGDWVYALDWQHPAYRCWPHQVDLSVDTGTWPVPVFPNGDYYIFAAHDFRFGVFGHPWEATLCVWGIELLDAVKERNSGVLTRPLRRDGQPVGDLPPD